MDSIDFLELSSQMAEPLCEAFGLLRYRLVAPLEPGKFSNLDSTVAEVALRVLIASSTALLLFAYPFPILITATALGLGSKIFKAIGFALQENGYSHILGKLPETTLKSKAKIMIKNLCGIGGGMHFDHGGVSHWRDRLDGIVAEILFEDPDVLILQEVYDTSFAHALADRLGPRFAHFFAHLGANVWGSVGGGFVATKCAYSTFTNTSFETNDWTLNRTFTVLDIRQKPNEQQVAARIIGTHLIHNDPGKRLEQLRQIDTALARNIPNVLAGDLNIERDGPEGEILKQRLTHGYLGAEPTCTNKLTAEWTGIISAPEETIDYISLYHTDAAHLEETHLSGTFDYNTSDHLGVVSTLSLSPHP